MNPAEEAQQAAKKAPVAEDVVTATWLGNDSDEDTIRERGGREVVGVVFVKDKPTPVRGKVICKKLRSLEIGGSFAVEAYDKKHGTPVPEKLYVQAVRDLKALAARAKAEQARRRGSAV